MYDIDMKQSKVGKKLFLIILVTVIVLLAFCMCMQMLYNCSMEANERNIDLVGIPGLFSQNAQPAYLFYPLPEQNQWLECMAEGISLLALCAFIAFHDAVNRKKSFRAFACNILIFKAFYSKLFFAFPARRHAPPLASL